jgi:hypothetical protein
MSSIEIPASVQNDRNRIEQTAIAATKQLAELKRTYDSSPAQRIERDRERLAELQNNPFHLNAKLAGNSVAHNEEAAIRARIAIAQAETVPVQGADRLAQAFTGDRSTDPLADLTINNELPIADMRAVIADGRARGHRDEIVQEGFLPNTNPPEIVAAARSRLEQRQRDPEWSKKLFAGDPDVRAEFDKLCLVARPREDEY